MVTATKITRSAAATQKLGESLAKKIKAPKIIALESTLGGGKTTFMQGLAKGFGIKTKVVSPTFVLERIYPIPKQRFSLYHYDMYRLPPDQLLVSEILENAKTNVVAIEWAEKIKKYLPKNTVWIKITVVKGNQRKIQISSGLPYWKHSIK